MTSFDHDLTISRSKKHEYPIKHAKYKWKTQIRRKTKTEVFILGTFTMYNIKNIIMKFLNDGGPLFMYSLLLLLVVIIFLLIKVFTSKTSSKKLPHLINSIGTFTLLFGVFGQIIGLLSAFSFMQETSVSQEVLAAGLKISFYPTVFGVFIFLISKLGIIIHTWSQKEQPDKI